jgi:ectoine hydroxylase-related dioxygenase (phytanoyl-CoA dioxygenase family)
MVDTATTQLTPEEQALLPTQEDVAFYREHGWYISKRIFTDEEIDAAVAGSERFYAGEREDFPLPEATRDAIPRGWVPEDGDVLRKNDYTSLQNRELRRLVHKPLLGAVASRLTGAPIRLWHDQLLYKPPLRGQSAANVGWHTDRQYWRVCSSESMLTAWVPFHDSFEEQGTITMIDGSHRWPDNTFDLDFWNVDLDALQERFQTGGEEVRRVPMNLPRGHVSFHSCKTIHGSGPNLSDRPRRSIAIHLQDGPNRYQPFTFRSGNRAEHNNDHLCRQVGGVPDYADPLICPQLWPAG